jgi:hypothetical protein
VPARTTRKEARDRLLETTLDALDRIIPADESKPLRGTAFGSWEGQTDAFKRAVIPTILEERAGLEANARVGQAGPQTPAASAMAEYMEAWPWDGRVARVVEAVSAHARRLGEPQPAGPPQHPRRVPSRTVGHLTRHQDHTRYPAYRANGWPIGSGETEAAVKQFDPRVKRTEQFRREAGIEPILSLRAAWIGQDDRWHHYWDNRPADVN